MAQLILSSERRRRSATDRTRARCSAAFESPRAASLLMSASGGYRRKSRQLPRSSEASSRAIDEYLAVLDDAAFGAATPVTPKFISPVDPAARWTAANKGPAVFAYATNYLMPLPRPDVAIARASGSVRET